MAKAFFGLGVTTGTYADRLALTSPTLGALFYQTDTDEIVKFGTDVDGTQRWMMADHDYSRNLVVNGGFDVWQRATTSTVSTADYYGPADRWQTTRLSSDTGRTFSRQPITSSDTPVLGFTYFMRCQRDASNAALNSILMVTSFETTSVRRTQNKYVTLSFYARAGANYSAASGFLRAYVTTGTGTDGRLLVSNFTSPTVLVDSNNTLTTSWKRFTVTTSAPVGSTITQMGVSFQFTPVGTAGAADYYDVTGVQLEAASAPSEFEFEPFETTLRKCQRYFQRYVDPPLIGVVDGTTRPTRMSMVLPVVMRADPTAAFAGTLNFFDGQAASGAFSSVQSSWLKTTSVQFDFNLTVGFPTIGRAVILYVNGGGTMSLSAEL
jgi:hypothetical protein